MFKCFVYSLLFIVVSFTYQAFGKDVSNVQTKTLWAKTIAPQTNTRFNLNYYSSLKPVVYKDTIIVASSSGHISAFNKNTAWRSWTELIKGESFYFSKLYKTTLLLGSLSGNLFAFDVVKKELLWKKKLPEDSLYKAVIYKKQLLLFSEKSQLLSLNISNSEVVWSKKIVAANLKLPEIRVKNTSELALKGHKLYIKQLYKLSYFNLQRKKTRWTKKYTKNLREAKYFKQKQSSYLINNTKYKLAGSILKESSFVYIYTQSNSLIKIFIQK